MKDRIDELIKDIKEIKETRKNSLKDSFIEGE